MRGRSVLPLNFSKIIHFLFLQEVIYTSKVFNYPFVGEFINFAHQTIKEITVVRNNYKSAVKVDKCIPLPSNLLVGHQLPPFSQREQYTYL